MIRRKALSSDRNPTLKAQSRAIDVAVPTSVGMSRAHQIVNPRRGFSFVEILFAVMVLGIGFIMIAAIFPVALRQTQSTTEETVAATVAKGAVNYLTPYSALMTNATATDNTVHAISLITSDKIGSQIAGNMILASDPRYAWVAMYRRGMTTGATPQANPFVQIIVIATQVRNRSIYDASNPATSDLVPHTDNSLATLQAKEVTPKVHYSPAGIAQLTFTFASPSDPNNAVGEGSYLVIADDAQPVATSWNGFVFRVGNLVSSTATTTTWELMPGNDFTGVANPPAEGASLSCWVVGRGYDDPTVANPSTFSGPVQDAAVYTTFITP